MTPFTARKPVLLLDLKKLTTAELVKLQRDGFDVRQEIDRRIAA